MKISRSDRNKKVLARGSESIKIPAIIKHFQEMRGIGYSIINMLMIGNAKLTQGIIAKTYPQIIGHLKKDVSCGIGLYDVDISPDLFHEAYELLFNIINIKEFQKTCIQKGVD